jgi:hypothetical protein
MSMILDGTNGVTFNDASLQGAAASPYVLKNRIINGDMVIDQRNNGAAITNTGSGSAGFAVDRFTTLGTQNTRLTMQQNAGSVTPPAGFTKYLGITTTSAYSVTSSDWFITQHRIEGFNVADLGWGTANARTVTLSFWVRSSLTGTFGGSLQNDASNRSYPFSYTISAANTWEYKTITIPGDTTGTWLTNNETGIQIRFGLGVGSTFSGTAGSWSGSNFFSATGATSVVGTNGATFYITGVQLEQNTSATPFERRLYNQELANCQRYFELFGQSGIGRATGATTCDISFPYCVTKRATPTIALFSSALNQITEATVATRTATSISASYPGTNGTLLSFGVSGGGMTSPNMILAFPNNYPNGFISASAEL